MTSDGEKKRIFLYYYIIYVMYAAHLGTSRKQTPSPPPIHRLSAVSHQFRSLFATHIGKHETRTIIDVSNMREARFIYYYCCCFRCSALQNLYEFRTRWRARARFINNSVLRRLTLETTCISYYTYILYITHHTYYINIL